MMRGSGLPQANKLLHVPMGGRIALQASRKQFTVGKLTSGKRPPQSRKSRLTGCVQATISQAETLQTQARPALHLSVAAHEIPHPAKASYGGEDAYFISQQDGCAFGVADGVGGWANSGINPADYSKTLMSEVKKHLEGIDVPGSPTPTSETAASTSATPEQTDAAQVDGTEADITQAAASNCDRASSSERSASDSATSSMSSSGSSISSSSISGTSSSGSSSNFSTNSLAFDPTATGCIPQNAIAAAHKATKQPGSATACVVQLKPGSSTLTAANLGDSGFALFRQGQLIFQSTPLQHFFDCPYQLASCPEFTNDTDRAEDAAVYNVQLQANDVVVVATDGLWDNLHIYELASLLPRSEQDVKQAAVNIANAASSHAHDEEYSSPYSREALKQGIDISWWDKLLGAKIKDGKPQLAQLVGGKVDDITVIVAYVGCDGSQQVL